MNKHFKRIENGSIPFVIVSSIIALYFLVLEILSHFHLEKNVSVIYHVIRGSLLVLSIYIVGLWVEKSDLKVKRTS